MADTAAHLVDRVFPEVPVRQWVLTLPVALRYRMAFDAALTAEVHRAFIRTLFAALRRRARKHLKIRYAHAGAVSFVQRFGDALNLNVHFHVLVLDGVFDADDAPRMRFIPLAPPDNAEILRALWFADENPSRHSSSRRYSFHPRVPGPSDPSTTAHPGGAVRSLLSQRLAGSRASTDSTPDSMPWVGYAHAGRLFSTSRPVGCRAD
jgi:hypothetical protein